MELVGIILGAIYITGIWKFLSGFKRTNFTQNKIILGLLWPVLLVNRSYRQNFTKALKG